MKSNLVSHLTHSTVWLFQPCLLLYIYQIKLGQQHSPCLLLEPLRTWVFRLVILQLLN